MITPSTQSQTTIEPKKKEIYFADESIALNRKHPLKLILQFEKKRFSALVSKQKSLEFVALESFVIDSIEKVGGLDLITGIISRSRILKEIDFTEVVVQFVNRDFTLVPAAVFETGDIQSIYSLNCGSIEGRELFSEKIGNTGIRNIYSVDSNLVQLLKKNFEQVAFTHHQSSVINACYMEQVQRQDIHLYLNFQQDLMDCVLFTGKQLLIANSYPYLTNEDAVYFALLVAEQHALDVRSVPVTTLGSVTKNSQVFKMLNTQFPNLEIGRMNNALKFSYGFSALHPADFFSLFNQVLCVS